MTAQLIQEMDTPQRYKSPQEVVAEWMIYYRDRNRRWPSITQLAELTGLKRTQAAGYRRRYLREHPQ